MLIEKYTPNWVKDFANLKREIENGLHGLEVKIEHVGSTSVPNLDSKPIIDMDIVYSYQADFEEIKLGLEKIGYYHNGNQGIVEREVFKRNGKPVNGILDSITHHLYVCKKNSKALERHILLRNFLRNNEWARIEYQEKKYELARKANQNKTMYAELKELNINGFIDEIIEKGKTDANNGYK